MSKALDYAVVGHNYISYLLSIGLLKRKKNILLVDDHRFNFGDLYTQSLSRLDIDYLIAWGKIQDIQALAKIDQFISIRPLHFQVGDKKVLLGRSPLQNYRELCRKFPQYFKTDEGVTKLLQDLEGEREFNQAYYDFSDKISEILIREKNISKMSMLFSTALTEDLRKKFTYFYSHFGDSIHRDEHADFSSFIFIARGFFQKRMGPTGSLSELLHLFLSLLSPHYHLDHEGLRKALSSHYEELGGKFKKIDLSELKYQGHLIQSFAIESDEGILKSKKMAFVGGYPMDLPIKLQVNQANAYTSLEVKLTLKTAVEKTFQNQFLIFSTRHKIGTDRPFWMAKILEKEIHFHVVIGKTQGSKVEFIRDAILSELLNELSQHLPELQFTQDKVEMNFSQNLFIEDRDFSAHKRSESKMRTKITNVIEETTPLFSSRLRNALYFGPYNSETLGVFSTLSNIRRWQDKL